MIISGSQLAVLALVAVVGWLGAKWLFQKDTEIEDRRRGAAKLASSLRAYGLTKIPDFMIDYSVGDYSGMAMKIKALAEMFAQGEAGVISEFDQVFDKVLGEKLKSEAGRAFIAAKLSDVVKPADPASVKNAPTATVQ
jgi:hypothetical protein